MAEKFYVVDGHSHLYRAFYAIKGLTTRDGQPSNAVYGFTGMLRKLIAQHKPDYLAVAFDLPGPTFRHKLYADYKATRQHPPDDLQAQIPMTREVVEAMDIPILTCEGYEADDVLGTVARLGAERGVDVVLVTSDKDARQLLGPRVRMLDTKKDAFITAEDVREQDGIAPEQVVEAMSLSGDTSDNVPGVPKVGPKTALALIQQYGTLEEALAHADEVKGKKLQENLKTFADQARLSRKLVVIDTHVPMTIDFEACRFSPPDPEKLAPIYEKLNFRQFLEEFLDARPASEATTASETDYRLVDTPERFEAFLAELKKQPRFAVDTETTSTTPRAAKLVGLSFSWKAGQGWYLPVRGPLGSGTLDLKETLGALKPILEAPEVGKVGQHIKYDAVVLRNYDVALQGVAFDTMVAAFVLDSERRRYKLDDLAATMLGCRMQPISDLIGKGKKQITMDLVPVDAVCHYAAEDADVTWRLGELLEKQLAAQPELKRLYETIELPLIAVLTDMEFTGIGFDGSVLRAMSGWLADQIADLEKRIHAEAGEPFNIASPKQLGAILFDKLGMSKLKKTKTGASTNSDVLEQLAIEHVLPGLVLEYRQLTKLKSTYVDTLPEMVVRETGRIHTSFHQTGAATGRLSSSDPNLQNIPIRTEIGTRIRKAFVPSQPGDLLLSADYSQIELRILAHFSKDKALRQAFIDDQDIHRFVASQVNGVAPEDVTPEMRRAAKAVNFGIVYGLTAYGLSRDLRIPVAEADAFITEYFGRYPGVKAFIDETIAQAHEDGFARTLCGRVRPLPGLNDRNRNMRQFAERAAVNTVIQGTAADMIKIAMIRLHARLRETGLRARMLLQIHDELLFELPCDEEGPLSELVVGEMTGALRFDVPVKVNIAVGANWMEAK